MGFLPLSRRDAGRIRLSSIESAQIRRAGDGLYHGQASVEIPDRQNSIVSVPGLDDRNYRLNGVMQYAHGGMPVARVLSIQKTKVKIDGKTVRALVVTYMFASTPEAQIVKTLVDERQLSGLSIGFIVNAERRATEEEKRSHNWPDPERAVVITKSELLEISFVSIPANPRALIELPMGRSYSENDVEEARVLSKALRSVSPQQSRPLDRAIREAERLNRTCRSGGASAAFCDRARGRNAADLAAGLAALSRDTAALLRGGRGPDLDDVSSTLRDVRRDLARTRGVPSPPSRRSDLDDVTRTLRGLRW